MAEIVEYRIDRTLDELKLLVDFGIFDDQHAKEVIRQREIFEYGLRRRTKSKLDYLKYIRFETNLLHSIEKYRKTILKNSESLEDEIDRKIFRLQSKKLNEIIKCRSAHINALYRKLVTKFQFDKRLWIAYIEFATERKWMKRVSALYWRLLRVASSDESTWISAAQHEIDVNRDQNTARKLYLMGLRHHPKSLGILTKLEELCDTETVRKYKEQVEQEKARYVGEPATLSNQTAASEPAQGRSRMDIIYECYETKGIEETRKLYSTMENRIKEQTLSLYVGMIQVECWQLPKDNSTGQLDRVRAIYDKALTKFGRDKAKLWYEYLQFEHQHAKTLDDLERMNQIYNRAQASLDFSKVDRVIEKYTMLQVNQPSRVDIEYSDYSDLDD